LKGNDQMSWIGVESADDDRARARRAAGSRRDWMLKVRLDGRTYESRLLSLTEEDAHTYARHVSADYTLRPAR